METLLLSTGVVALAEMGDKTQLLAFLLASRYKKPLPIILGIFVATIFNHTLAGLAGSWLAEFFSPDVLRWVLALSFVAMAIWILIPDKMDDDGIPQNKLMEKWGAFGITFITFFLAEMKKKKKKDRVAPAAGYGTPFIIVAGTTLGMLIADVPAVWIGDKLSEKIPVKWVRLISATLFVIIGIFVALDFTPKIS